MTNGEKIKEVFPSIELYEKSHDAIQINFDSVWWNTEYKDPTTENDLGVDREDAVERLNALKQLIGYDKDSEIVKATQKSLDMAIKALDQEPKTGHWIKGYTFPDGAYWKCDKCNELIKVKIPMRYCNNCGAKMAETEDT